MNKLKLILLTIIAFHVLTFGQQGAKTNDGKEVLLYENGTWIYADSVYRKITKLEIPRINQKDKIVSHLGYSLLYNELHEQANWVAYEMTKEETNKLYGRTDKFIPDPKVKTGTANDKDYAGSGYDRGHLAPASDMGWSATSMAESFYYSNMSPQTPSFNRGVWKRLEELIRTWAIDNEKIYIATGPILKSGLPTIGVNKVSVPDYYYKVVLHYTETSAKGIGFILSNSGSNLPLQDFTVSIDSIESLTGIDFFPLLPDNQEIHIEKSLCIPCWSWISGRMFTKNEDKNSNKSKR